MPEMGESVTEGTVLEWHVAEGETIEEGETLVEVSTDKVDAEVPAPFSGTLTKIHVGPDETIEVGKPLATMLKGATPSASSASAPAPATASQPGTPGSEAEDVPADAEEAASDGEAVDHADDGDSTKATPCSSPRRSRSGCESLRRQGLRPRRQGDQGRRARRKRRRRGPGCRPAGICA